MRINPRFRALRWPAGSLLLLLLVAGMLGCGGSSEKKGVAPPVITGLRIEVVHRQSLPDEVEAPGTVVSVRTAEVAARTMGTVERVLAREGDVVRSGQLLAQLDERELSARRNAARAALEEAQAAAQESSRELVAAQAQSDVARKTYERFLYLREQKSVSPQEFDEVEGKQRAAQAALEAARARERQAGAGRARAQSESRAAEAIAGYARILSPFAGVVARRMIDPGSMATPGVPLFIVEDTSRYRLEVTLPTDVASAVRRGTRARIRLDAIPEREFEGTVTELEAGADPASHTVRVRIELPRGPAFRSGLFGRAFFRHGQRQAFALPSDAVIERGQLRGVYVVGANGVAEWRLVTLGRRYRDRVEILSGVSEGDRVAVNPPGRELDGVRVEATR